MSRGSKPIPATVWRLVIHPDNDFCKEEKFFSNYGTARAELEWRLRQCAESELDELIHGADDESDCGLELELFAYELSEVPIITKLMK